MADEESSKDAYVTVTSKQVNLAYDAFFLELYGPEWLKVSGARDKLIGLMAALPDLDKVLIGRPDSYYEDEPLINIISNDDVPVRILAELKTWCQQQPGFNDRFGEFRYFPMYGPFRKIGE